LPGLRNSLLPRRDALGNEIPNELTGIKAFVDLFNSSTPQSNPIINELGRLYEFDVNAVIERPKQDITLYKQKIKLTDEQRDKLERETGTALREELEKLIYSDKYFDASDEDKIDMIDKTVLKIRKDYMNENPQYFTGEEREVSDDSPKNIVEKIQLYMKGFSKDPKNTWRAAVGPEVLRKVVGDASILERKKFLSILDKGNGNSVVDHIIPLSLGGTNDINNLRVTSAKENQDKRNVEVYLLNLLSSGKISKKEAQRRVLNWRNELKNL
jgi:hypothetical protein